MKISILYSLLLIMLLVSCTKEKAQVGSLSVHGCNLSTISIFPHPNDAGITLSILVMDRNTKKARFIKIGDEVCGGYRLYRIMPNGIELKYNEQTKQIAYANTNIIAEPAIKLEQENRQAVKKAEQLQKYGIPQTMDHIHGTVTQGNAIVNSFSGTKFTER